MQDCIFCKIARKEIPAQIIFEDEQILAFRDIDPKAPQHILLIPKEHIATINDLVTEQSHLVGRMTLTAAQLAKQLGFANQGYRLVMNCNEHGGQTVFHIHLHLLAGRHLLWPPG